MSKGKIKDNNFKKFVILLLFEAINKIGLKMNQVFTWDYDSDDWPKKENKAEILNIIWGTP